MNGNVGSDCVVPRNDKKAGFVILTKEESQQGAS